MKKQLHYALIFSSALLMSACSQVNTSKKSNDQIQNHQTPSHQVSTQRKVQHSPVTKLDIARIRMVNIARSTIGAPYKWGGSSPKKGFDCSGLMTYVHTNAIGLKIPRTVAQQRDNSRTINYSQLQPGDMLFFKTNKRTNHVGVYIGNRKFIHAPSGGKRVTVATMDSSYWHKRFVKFGTYL